MQRSAYLRLQRSGWAATFAVSAALVVPVTFVEGAVETWAEIDPMARTGGQLLLLLYTFLVRSPLEMAMVVLAVMPFWRLRRMRMRAGLSRRREIMEGVSFSTAAALGSSTLRHLVYLHNYGDEWFDLMRIGVAGLLFSLLCGVWGYGLGRDAQRGWSSRRFSGAWIVATLLYAASDQMVLRRSPAALLAVTPLMAMLLVGAVLVWREVRSPSASSGGGRFSLFTSGPAPSLDALRDAFRRQDRPITLRWISFGALVTTGMITTGVFVAVLVGREMGLDFSAVDRTQTDSDAMAALGLLGIGALAAFPAAGYLLARASGARSVLEPATATALAMVLVMVFMGMLSPLSVVFAIAFAPIAFALSCAGAWVGLGR